MNPLDEAMGLTPASAPVRQVSVDSTDEAAPGQPIGAARGVSFAENGASAGRPKAGRRLQRALSVNTALRTMGKDGESLRELLGEQDLASKTFLKNLTLPPAETEARPSRPRSCRRRSAGSDVPGAEAAQPPLPSDDLDELLACGAAALPELEALVGDAVRKAGLQPRAQPNTFIEIAQGGDELYTAATLGPLKTRERCAEKATNEYGGDVRRLVDICRASVVVDTEDQLEAVFRHLLADPASVIRLKNRFANPSFNGYRDALFTVRLDLPQGGSHLAEVQVHLSPILELKAEAHVYYDFFRRHFHGNMESCDVCMKLLDGVVGRDEFSVDTLEKVARSRDVARLAMMGRLFDVHCQQYQIAKLFLVRCAQVEGERGGSGYPYALRNVGEICQKTGDDDETEKWLRRSIEVSRNALAQPAATLGPDLAAGLSILGNMLTQRGDHAGAEKALLESTSSRRVVRAASVRRSWAWCYQRNWAARPARPRGRRPPTDGPSGRAAPPGQRRRARVYDEQEHAKSGKRHRARRQRLQHGLRADDPRHVATPGRTVRRRRRTLTKCYKSARRPSVATTPSTAVALRKRGTPGDICESRRSKTVAWPTRIFIKYGEESSDAIKAMTEMAEVCLCIPGELDAAEGYSRRAHTAACKRFEDADDHVVLQEARATLGRVHSARGRHEQAFELLGRFETASGDRERHRASFLIAKARAAPRDGKFRELVEEALRIREKKWRPEDELAEARALLE